MKTRVFKDKAGEWRWTRYAENGEPISDSDEGYDNKSHAIHMAELNQGDEIEIDD